MIDTFSWKYLSLLISGFLLFSALGATEKEISPEQASARVAANWIKLIDQGLYDASWTLASPLMQLTIPKMQWEQLLKAVRTPLGEIKSRKIVLQSPAENPKNLPRGEYMIILYESVFEKEGQLQNVQELITLNLGSDEQWHVLTYLINPVVI